MTGIDVGPEWSLALYVSGASPRSTEAIDTIRQICDIDLGGRVDLQIIDVGKQPALAVDADILAVPTLIKRLPPPFRKLVGDLSDAGRVRSAIGLEPMQSSPAAALLRDDQ